MILLKIFSRDKKGAEEKKNVYHDSDKTNSFR